MKTLCCIALLASLAVGPAIAVTPEERGDRAWGKRAEGFAENSVVPPGPAQAAVEAYEEALIADPGNFDVRFKLIEALYFRGSFATEDKRESKRIFDRMLELAEEAVTLAPSPQAAPAHFWAGIAWGVWGMSHPRMASAVRGVAARIRDHAEILIRLDESYADAGGLRLLGRLHTEVPRVPFVTGWADRHQGLTLLERALATSQREHRNLLFLAEAILKHAPSRRAEAVELLQQLNRRQPDAARIVEESQILELAGALLRRLQSVEARPLPGSGP